MKYFEVLNKINIQDVVNFAKKAGSAIMKFYDKDINIKYKQPRKSLVCFDIEV